MPRGAMRAMSRPATPCDAYSYPLLRLLVTMKVCACHGVDGTGFTTLKRSDVHRLPVMTSRVFIAFP
jgi:hypothetical protein